MTIFTVDEDEFESNFDGGIDDYTLDIDAISPDANFEIETDAVDSLTERSMQKLESALARAYITGAVALDVHWYRPTVDIETFKLYETEPWYDNPPEETDAMLDPDVQQVERYDLTTTTDEEVLDAMEQSDIEFGHVEAYLRER